jgi:hypothetical protein
VPQTWQLPESQPIEPTSRASIWVVFENLNLLEASALMAHLPEHHKTSFYKDALSGLTDVNCRVVNRRTVSTTVSVDGGWFAVDCTVLYSVRHIAE